MQETHPSYKITLINQALAQANTTPTTIHVRGDETILDAAEHQGVELPTSCRAGACISCTGKLMKGSIEHDHCFLKNSEKEAGFILTCTAYPRSDCAILTHQEDALLDLADRV